MPDSPIIEIGKIEGRVLIFGGVYGNFQALESMHQYALKNNYEAKNIFCTGDIMGYCAQPEECVQFIKYWNINVIAGNVEKQVRDNADDCGCNFSEGGRCDRFSKTWYQYVVSKVSADSRNWLHLLPDFIKFKYADKNVTVVHGSWSDTSEFIFKSTRREIKEQIFEVANSQVIIAGHCGIPFENIIDNKYWLNAGVIGMPANDGTNRVWFLTLDDSKGVEKFYKIRSLKYDYETTFELMKANGLPSSYADTLISGIWDNCEILPEIETMAQGQALTFR